MPGSEKSLDGARVLVVEDNFLAAEAVCDLLRSHGCIVVGPAPRLKRGLCLARDEELDAALLDINLNGERCFPIAEMLRRRNVPFLFVTGYDDSITIPAPLRHTPLLDKPAMDAKLIAALGALLAHRPHTSASPP
jgi:DNA-binding response OmpR family regulator